MPKMEDLSKNKETACVFARYLEREHSRKYDVVLPEAKDHPFFDAMLVSAENGNLPLQMKQVVQGDTEFMRSRKGQPGMGRPGKDWKMFANVPIGSVVEKAEKKYKDRARDLILILHDDEGYLIPSDADLIDKNDFKQSNFRGIYMVSPKHELWKAGIGKRIQDEFASEIKNAFN